MRIAVRPDAPFKLRLAILESPACRAGAQNKYHFSDSRRLASDRNRDRRCRICGARCDRQGDRAEFLAAVNGLAEIMAELAFADIGFEHVFHGQRTARRVPSFSERLRYA